MKKQNRVAKYMFFVIYYTIWMFILSFSRLASRNGVFCVFSDLYGNYVIWLGYIVAFVIMFLPFILTKHIKTELKKFIISFAITTLFCVITFVSFVLTASYYREFDTFKWYNYPNQRYLMIDDLVKNQNILGDNKKGVEELLGKPDRVSKNGDSYYYKYGSYGEIEIVFLGAKAKKIYLH